MAKFEQMLTGDFQAVLERLHESALSGGASMQLVDQSDFRMGEVRVAVRVYDKYYMRNSSRASLSLTVAAVGDEIAVSAIGAGGGNGAFFNFSWGTEEDILFPVREATEAMARAQRG